MGIAGKACGFKVDGAPCPSAAVFTVVTALWNGTRVTRYACERHFRSFKSRTIVATGKIR